MKKSDLLFGLKADLKSLRDVNKISNIDYHRGRIDQLQFLINDIKDPIQRKRYEGMLGILSSKELRLV